MSADKRSSAGIQNAFHINIEELKSIKDSSSNKQSPLYKYSCDIYNQNSFF
jgi:hypothetical protein